MSKNNNCCKKTSIGGQALMEGIMMRGPEVSAMAVRNTKGEIVLEKFPTETKKRSKFTKLPIIRGLFNYIDSMSLGTKCLMRSAEISGLEEAEEELRREKEAKKAAKEAKKAAKKGIETTESAEKADIAPHTESPVTEESVKAENTDECPDPEAPAVENNVVVEEDSSKNGKNCKKKEEKKKDDTSVTMGIIMTLSVVLSLVIAIGLFFVLPTYIYSGVTYLIPAIKPKDLLMNSLVQSVFEGVIKLAIIIGYMALMTLMKDIKRTFQFHGAEHKTIFCYEAGLELTVENVRKQRRFHPRCGTSFLILMIIVSIFIGFFITPLYIWILGEETVVALGNWMNAIRAATRILLIPLIVGIGYELIKIAGKHDNWLTRIISAPGVWLQHITVLEPDDGMIECAIVAMKEVIPEDDSDKW